MSLRSSEPKFHVTYYPPEDQDSPQTPETGRNGESGRDAPSETSSEGVGRQQFAAPSSDQPPASFHHPRQRAGESETGAQGEESTARPEDGSPAPAIDWDEVAAFIAEMAAADPTLGCHQQVVKAEGDANAHDADAEQVTHDGKERTDRTGKMPVAPTSTAGKPESRKGRRNTQPLTLSEEDRFLLCLSLGHSLRQAASTIGVHHTTMVKRAKRDPQFAQAIALAKAQARTDPMQVVRQASQKSWRAAAWLLEYLDRRDELGRRKRPA